MLGDRVATSATTESQLVNMRGVAEAAHEATGLAQPLRLGWPPHLVQRPCVGTEHERQVGNTLLQHGSYESEPSRKS